MKVNPGRRPGVSEILATILMIGVTLVGFGLYFGVVQRNLSLGISTPLQQYQNQAKVAGEQLSLSYASIGSTSVTLYIFNYGTLDVTLRGTNTLILVPPPPTSSPVTINLAQITITDPLTGNPQTGLRAGVLSKISVTATVTSPLTIALVTSNGALFEWRA